MIHFLLGSVAIVAPRHQVPLIGAYFLSRALGRILRRRRRSRPSTVNTEFGVTLRWSRLNLTLDDPSNGISRRILDDVSGVAHPGRLLAVMGPSGAGKTSLLNALARQVPYSNRLHFRGKIELNDVPVSTDDAVSQAYVQQEDLFYSCLTLRETLTMACALRLPPDLPTAQRDRLVDGLIEKLGLSSCADTIVGDAKTRGLSGGEKKRLSIGCELINSPVLMFLDEPTTGLDAFQAEKVMKALKRLADEGHTIVCTIHQPRSSIFSMFDDLVLLAEGKVVYAGMADRAIDYFAKLGHQCPEHYNPAEYFADLISIDTSSPKTTVESRSRVEVFVDKWAKMKTNAFEYKGHPQKEIFPNRSIFDANNGSNWFRDFRLLLGRSWKQARRDKKTNIARLGMNVGSALIFGGIYFRMKMLSSTVPDRIGLLQLSAVNTAMSALVKTVNIFPSEQTIVTRERAKKAYGVVPYLCAKILSDVPVGALLSCTFGALLYSMTGLNPSRSRSARFMGIVVVEAFASAALGLTVGSVAPSTEVAVALGPMVMLLFIVFGGQFKNTESTSTWLRWVPNASLIQNAFQGMCINEFEGVTYDVDNKAGIMSDGAAVLNYLGFTDRSIEDAIVRNVRVMMFNYWLTYTILNAKKPKFTQLSLSVLDGLR